MKTITGNASAGDVAARAGVSVATVSRALRGMPNVAPATRERVLAAAEALDYSAHPLASRLAAGRTMTVGLVLPMLGQWYIAKVLAGVEAVLAPAGYDVLLHAVTNPTARQRFVADTSPLGKRVDGLIIVGVDLPRASIDRWKTSGARIVTIGRRIDPFPSVTIDDAGAAALAARHLANLGHRRIGFIGARTGQTVYGAPTARRRGLVAELRRLGIETPGELRVDAELCVDGGRAAMDQLLAIRQPPTAVVAISDELAVGAIDSVRQHGWDVPRHVSVIGFDDHDLAAAIGLTTIRQSGVNQGSLAAELLLEQLEGRVSDGKHRRDEIQLVVRKTTRPLRTS